MIRLPPRSTRTDTLFPYTTLFRSGVASQPYTAPALLEGSIDLGPFNYPKYQVFVFVFSIVVSVAVWLVLSRTRRSEEHTSELQSLMRNSYAVFCLKKKNQTSSY